MVSCTEIGRRLAADHGACNRSIDVRSRPAARNRVRAPCRSGSADALDGARVFRNLRDEAVGEAVVSVLRKSPAALTSLGEDRLKRLLAGYPEQVRRDSEPLFQQLRKAQDERIEKLQKLEPLL